MEYLRTWAGVIAGEWGRQRRYRQGPIGRIRQILHDSAAILGRASARHGSEWHRQSAPVRGARAQHQEGVSHALPLYSMTRWLLTDHAADVKVVAPDTNLHLVQHRHGGRLHGALQRVRDQGRPGSRLLCGMPLPSDNSSSGRTVADMSTAAAKMGQGAAAQVPGHRQVRRVTAESSALMNHERQFAHQLFVMTKRPSTIFTRLAPL